MTPIDSVIAKVKVNFKASRRVRIFKEMYPDLILSPQSIIT